MILALLVVIGLGVGTSKAFDHNRHISRPKTFTADEYCKVTIALHERDFNLGLETTKGIPDTDICF